MWSLWGASLPYIWRKRSTEPYAAGLVGEEEEGSLSAFSSVSLDGLRLVESSITVVVAAVTCGAGDVIVEGCSSGVGVTGDCDAGGSTATAKVAADGIDEMGLTSDAAGTLVGKGRC